MSVKVDQAELERRLAEEPGEILRFPKPTLPEIMERIESFVNFVIGPDDDPAYDSNILGRMDASGSYARLIAKEMNLDRPKAVFGLNLDTLDVTETCAPEFYFLSFETAPPVAIFEIKWPTTGGMEYFFVVMDKDDAFKFSVSDKSFRRLEANDELVRSISWWFE